MSRNNSKKRSCCKSGKDLQLLQLAGIVLMAFGATTLCAFLLPIKIWVFLLGLVLLFCGVLLFIN